MRIEKFLNDVIAIKGFSQDRELAAWLNVTPPAISQYRKGVRTMDNEKCVTVALELGIDPIQVIMATDLDKAERSGQKSQWEVFSNRAARAAGVALLGFVTLFVTPTPSEAAPALKLADTTVYIMLNRRRRLLMLRTVFTVLKRWLSGPALQPATS